MITALLLIVTGLFLSLIGYLVRHRDMGRILAGYAPGTLWDEEAYGRWLGSRMMIAGVCGMIIGVVGMFLPAIGLYLLLAYVAVLLAGSMISDLGGERPGATPPED